MSTLQAHDEESIFAAAIECKAPGERAAFLKSACGGDQQLIRRVEALLSSHEEAGTFLNEPAAPAATIEQPPMEIPGNRIGPYKLRELLGEGGMGSVFVAEQQEPIRRKVALKVIKPGMDSRQVLGRFEAERHTLALMDHPNIAKVLDAGTTDSGRPYFVMELVRGVPITEFCDQRRLTPRQRLELFIQVCRAIQHAHQKGIIHRDIKPSNILVTLHDDLAVSKVIDFGIAKATNQQLTEQSVYTAFSQLIGTPLYMSPEQAEMNALDVDTRSDVYSLGVLLYELLTGSTPFHNETLRQAGFDGMRRLIREVDPPRPSQRVSTLAAEAASTVSQSRGIDHRRLGRALRGDLDLIVMKALEKDRNRRYESASALAADVQRCLDGEPIQARPPRMFAGARKWCRRHPAVLWSGALLLLATALISAASGILLANANRREATQRQQAEANAQRAEVISKFLVKAFRSPSPDRDGRTVTVAEVLDRSSKELKVEFAAAPATKAELLGAIGKAYVGLGLYSDAIPLLEESHRLWVRASGPENLKTLQAATAVASAYVDAGRIVDAIKMQEQTLETARAKLGPTHVDTLEAMENLAIAYQEEDRLDKAITLFEEVDRLAKNTLETDHYARTGYTENLAQAYVHSGRLDEALPLLEKEYELDKVDRGPKHAVTLVDMHNLAMAYAEAGRSADAIKLYEETLELRRNVLGTDHPETLNTMNGLATAYQKAGQGDKSLPQFEELVTLAKARLGPAHPLTILSLTNLAGQYEFARRWDDAVPLYEQVLELQRSKFGPNHLAVLQPTCSLAYAYRRAGQVDKAIPMLEETLRMAQNFADSREFGAREVGSTLAWLLATAPTVELRDGKRAVELATTSCDLTKYKNADHIDILAAACAEAGDFEAAVKWAEKALKLVKNNASLGEQIKTHLDSFRQEKPWREDK